MSDTVASRWAHPEVILVATNLSDLDHVMPVAFAQARETGARLILFHSVTASIAFTADATGMPYFDATEAIQIAEHVMSLWCERAQGLNLHCHSVVREGDPVERILAAIRQFHVDRILVGTRSRSKLSKMLIGSVAEQVLRLVTIPVMTIGPEAHLLVDHATQRVVLYATSLRETSSPIAALAYSIAAVRNARLVLLHVVPPGEEITHKGLPIGLDADAMRDLQVLAKQLAAGDTTEVESVVVHGNPAVEILAQASMRHAGLLVLGATRYAAFESIGRDRTVYRVLAHAGCPVLTLREHAETTEQSGKEQTAVSHP